MSQTEFTPPAYFPGGGDIAAIEEQLMSASGAEWFRLAAELAWYCRQEPSDRALDMIRRIQLHLPTAQLEPIDRRRLDARLGLVRGEVAWTRSNYAEADRIFGAAMAICREIGDDVGFGDGHSGMAFTRWQGNEIKLAQANFSAAREAYLRAGDQTRAAYARYALAAIAAFENSAKALDEYGPSIATDAEESDPVLGPYIKAYLARPALMRGEIGAAIRYWIDSLALALKSSQYSVAAAFLMGLGESFMYLNDYDTALDYFNQAVELGRKLRAPFWVGMNLGHIANVMRVLKRVPEAREFLEIGLESWRGIEDSRWYVFQLMHLADVTLDLGRPDDAMQWYDDAIARITAVGTVQPLEAALTGKARALVALGRLDEAVAVADRAVAVGQETGALTIRIEAMLVTADIHRRRGDFDRALAVYAQAEERAASIAGYSPSAHFFNEIAACLADCERYDEAYRYALKAQSAGEATHMKEASNRAIALQIRHETERAHLEAEHHRSLAEVQTMRAAELEAAQLALRTLLDNADQGFLTIGAELIVGAQCSAVCERIFGVDPPGLRIVEILLPRTPERAATMRVTLDSIFATPAEAELLRALKIELLPKEFEIAGRAIFAHYKWLPQPGQLMFVLSDVTETRALQEAVDRERRRLEMIVMAVTESREFIDLSDEFGWFIADALPKMVTRAVEMRDSAELFRRVHTYKGLLAQFSFHHSPRLLHEIEGCLARIGTPEFDAQELDAMCRRLAAALKRDVENVTDVLGADYMASGGSIAFSADRLREFERIAKDALGGEIGRMAPPPLRHLLVSLSNLRALDVKSALALHSRGAVALAERLEKTLKPIEVVGDDVRLPEGYAGFFRALIHVFRNAVDHGIELPDERVEAGKPEAGSLTAEVRALDDAVEIVIEDDGRGIDRNALERKLVERGWDPAEVARLALDDMIFAEGLSSRDTSSEVSGRGVGLPAVRFELEKLGGGFAVATRPGAGTQFKFRLPRPDERVMAAA